MNTNSVISGLMAVCMMASAPAFAQRYDHSNDRSDQNDRHDQGQRGNEQNHQQDHHDRGQQSGGRDGNEHGDRGQRRDEQRGEQNRGYGRGNDYSRNDGYRRNDGYGRGDHGQAYRAYDNSRHDGYRYRMQRGGRLPDEYRGSRYVVNDWRGRHLSAPPRGYQWVQANNDYVLAAIATGLIAQVLLNN
jgi:Ni/Co efflux regulator RcnB